MFQIVGGPANGSASISGNTLTFTPNPDWNGTTSLTYRVQDGAGAWSGVATITITVIPVNDAPVAQAKSLTINEDTSGSVTLSATDIDSPTPTVFQVVAAPANGTANISGSTLTFTPNPNWNGTTSLTYRAQDSAGAWSAPATVSIKVNPVNDVPSVDDLTLSTPEDTPASITLPVHDVDLSFEGDSHTFAIISGPAAAQGIASISGNKLSFTPAANWNGTAKVTYQATDSHGAKSNVATLTITVTPVNDPPAVDDLTLTTPEDTPASITLPVHDVDLSFEGDSHTFAVVTPPEEEHGVASIVGNVLSFTPSQDWNGTLTFTYQATDSHGAVSNVGKITVTVTPVNDAPKATGATITVKEGQPSPHVMPWVVDPDIDNGDTFTFTVLSNPAHGTVVMKSDGLVYTPNPQYFGDDAFTIRATDSGGLTVDGDVNVKVAKFNYAPTDITPHSLSMFAGIGGSGQLAVTDPNTWGSTTLTVVQQPAHGTVSVDGTLLTYRTDGDQNTSVRIRATDQDGLYVEKDIALTFGPAWDFFKNREVVKTSSAPQIPAVAAQLTNTKGQQAFQISQPEVIGALGSDIVAIVTPDSSVGVTLQKRDLGPGIGMRLTPTVLASDDLEAGMGGLDVGKDGSATVYLSRADGAGPVYAVPVHVWAFQGALQADSWTIFQAAGRTSIKVAQTNSACTLLTNAQMAKGRNALDSPTCYVAWTQTPEEWRDNSSSTNLLMTATGNTTGPQQVAATVYVFDQNGVQQKMLDLTNTLTIKPISGQVAFALTPQIQDVYQKVQALSFNLKQVSAPTSCVPTVSADVAKKSSQQWQSNPSCLIQWIQLPDGLAQQENSTNPLLNGAMNSGDTQTVGWKVSIFTPSGTQIDAGYGGQDFNVTPPPPAVVTMPTTNFVKEGMYWVSQAGGSVGTITTSAIAADLTYQASLGGAQVENSIVLSYGQAQRFNRYMSANAAPLWSQTPFAVDVGYRAMPEVHTQQSVQLLAVPQASIKPVILNDQQKVLDSQALVITAGIRNTTYLKDPYDLASMGDWDIRLLSTTAGTNYQPLTDWQPIDASGNASFNIDLSTLTNKAVRIIAEARVHSPVPEYSLIRQGSSPLVLTVLNGNPLDGKIQALRIMGPAPLRNSFYAVTTDRMKSSDLGGVVWQLSSDDGATWNTVSSDPRIPQHLSYTFQRGHYLLRAQLTNRNSGAVSMTPTIDITAFVVPQARLKGPQNVFIDDQARFLLTDTAGKPLDTTGMNVDWSLDRGKTWSPSTTGDGTYTLTRSEAQRITLYGRVKYSDSPDDPSVYKKVTAGVAFRPVRPPRVQIIGPGHPEVGKQATWTANMMLPYPNMDVTMDGYFILPNGQQEQSKQVQYTPTQEDMATEKSYIGFQGWINGYEDRGGNGLTQHLLQFWKYVWPDWYIQSKFSAQYAPADLTMTARNRGTFQQFEGLKVDWDVPPYDGMSIIKESDQMSRIVRVTEPGTYSFGYTVTDSRGNLSTVTTEVEFLPPPPWKVQLAWSGDNKFDRAPLGILVRPSITGGHPKDRILTKAYSLDGAKLDSTGDYGRATLLTPGEHTVSLSITTEMGKAEKGEVTIPVVANQPPSCTVDVTNGRTSWLAKATCTDPDGRVLKNNWYINGELQALGSNNISVPMWRYPDGEPVITLVGVDDAGAESTPVSNK